MADPAAIQKITDFLEQLDREGISPSQFIQTFKATSATSAPQTIKKLDLYQAADATYKFHNEVIPRVGNIDSNGVWTGLGKGNKKKIVKDYCCYRNLDLQHKTLAEVSKITKACKVGLEDPNYHFVLATEKSETKLNDTLREMETFIVDHGLEGCFNLITKEGELNAFRHFGRISDEMANTWIDDVLRDGVFTSPGSSMRYELCPYDADNMEISGDAILNSCSPALKRTIMRELQVEERNGVSVFFSAIRNGRTFRNANVRSMCNDLEGMDIRKYPGENVLAFCHDAMDKVDAIRLAAQGDNDIEHLTQITIQGLSLGSDEGLRAEVRELIKSSSKPNSGVTPESATKDLSEYYIDANLRNSYGPASAPEPPKAFQAYVQQQINQITDKLTQSRGGSNSNGYKKGTSYAGGRGPSDRGSNDKAPRHISVSSGDTGDATTNKKVNDLVKASISSDGLPTDDKDHDIKENGEIVAKFCGKCRRWTKGNKLHYTSECRRQEAVPPLQTPSNSDANASQGHPEGHLAGNEPNDDGTNAIASDSSSLQSPSGMLSLRGADYELTPNKARSSKSNLSVHLKGYGGRGY